MQYIEMKGLTEYKAEVHIFQENEIPSFEKPLEVVKLDKRSCISNLQNKYKSCNFNYLLFLFIS